MNLEKHVPKYGYDTLTLPMSAASLALRVASIGLHFDEGEVI